MASLSSMRRQPACEAWHVPSAPARAPMGATLKRKPTACKTVRTVASVGLHPRLLHAIRHWLAIAEVAGGNTGTTPRNNDLHLSIGQRIEPCVERDALLAILVASNVHRGILVSCHAGDEA